MRLFLKYLSLKFAIMNKNKSLTIILKLNKKYFKNDNIKNNKIG